MQTVQFFPPQERFESHYHGEPYDSLLVMVPDRVSGSGFASDKQLAYIAHLAGFTQEQLLDWLLIARPVLSPERAHWLIQELKAKAM